MPIFQADNFRSVPFMCKTRSPNLAVGAFLSKSNQYMKNPIQDGYMSVKNGANSNNIIQTTDHGNQFQRIEGLLILNCIVPILLYTHLPGIA